MELQVALSGIAILKKSEQVVYTIMRMKRSADLLDTFVFDHEEIDMPEPGSPKPEVQESAIFPVLGSSQPLPLSGPSGGEEAQDYGLVEETNLRVLVAERNAAYKERDEAIKHAKQIEKDFAKLKEELRGLGNQAQSMGTTDDLRAPFRCGVDLLSCATSPACDKGD